MKRIKAFTITMFFVLLNYLPTITSAQEVGEKNIIELTNKLGVKVTYNPSYIVNVMLGETTLWEKICSEVENGFVLKLSESIIVLIPLESFKEATLKDGKHTVTLSNGKLFTGKLVGKIETEDKTYDLSTMSSIKLLQISKSDTARKKPPKKTWQLQTSNTSLTRQVIAEPKFAFGYYDKYKDTQGIFYTWETGTFIEATESFIIKTGGEEIAANLSDFEKVSVSNQASLPTKINITSQSNVTTSGTLILKKENKNNNGWALTARLPEMADVTVVLMKQNFSFQ